MPLVLALLLAPPVLAGHAHLTRERDEPGRSDLDGLGQSNGVPEAITDAGATDGGIEILDAFWASGASSAATQLSSGFGGVDSAQLNAHRASEGRAPDLILPGPGVLLAWYGAWRDVDADAVLDHLATGADAEWILFSRERLFAYVSPGSHPALSSGASPDEASPDLVLSQSSDFRMHASSGTTTNPTIMLDGSLFATYRIDVVSRPLLTPDLDGRPYTVGTDSLVDIDRYTALAEGSVSNLYGATIGDVVTAVGSPSLGQCPAGCRAPPFPVPGPASPSTGALQGSVYARYPQEANAGEGNTASGDLARFQQGFHGWIDLLPVRVHAGGRDAPLLGRSTDGRPAMAPGHLAAAVWTGVWKDLNEDAYVGVASVPDAYEHGNRAVADDYRRSAGEFIAASPSDPADGELRKVLRATFRPIPSWGDTGAILVWRTSMLPKGVGGTSVPGPEIWHVTGDAVVTLPLTLSNVEFGLHESNDALFLPRGTDGFAVEICTETYRMRFAAASVSVDEEIRDCDVVESWR